MKTNESEYKRLEVAIYDLKAENAKLCAKIYWQKRMNPVVK